MNLENLTDRMVALAKYDYETSVRLMLRCLAVIPIQLPQVAISAIDLATRYWNDRSIPKDELEEARVRCWNYLDEQSASTNTIDPEACALRAVICVLYEAPPSDEIAELIAFFNQVLFASFGNEVGKLGEQVSLVVEEFARTRNGDSYNSSG